MWKITILQALMISWILAMITRWKGDEKLQWMDEKKTPDLPDML